MPKMNRNTTALSSKTYIVYKSEIVMATKNKSWQGKIIDNHLFHMIPHLFHMIPHSQCNKVRRCDEQISGSVKNMTDGHQGQDNTHIGHKYFGKLKIIRKLGHCYCHLYYYSGR